MDVLNARGGKARAGPGQALPALLRRAPSSRPFPRSVKAIAVLDRTKEPGAIGEPLYLDVRTAIGEAWSRERPVRGLSRRSSAAATASAPRTLPPPWSKAVFDNLSQADTEEPLHRRHHRRRDRYQPSHRRFLHVGGEGRFPGHLLRPRRRRHRGGEQEHHQDHRRGNGQLRPGLLRLRLEEVGRP